MPIVRIDARRIIDWNTFHDVFVEALGFPDFYGRNMNAWIDCMTYLADPESRMTTVHGDPSNPVVLHIENIDSLPHDIYAAVIECSAFVNWCRIDVGEPAILCLSFYRSAH
jgi:RNAse (barnase) inhibitor barstar